MLSLVASLGFLGLAAVDPVGIAVMPVLLTQRHGIRRSVWFLVGSVLGIMTLGLVFAVGAGRIMLRVTKDYPWLEPGIEIVAGVALAGFGVYLWWRRRHGAAGPEVSDGLRSRLDLGGGKLFGFGAGLVIVQSLLDVVFIVAMINVGASNLPIVEVMIAVFVYAMAALILQSAIVVAYASVGPDRRTSVTDSVSGWLDRNGTTAAIVAALVVGGVLVASGVSALNGGPSLG